MRTSRLAFAVSLVSLALGAGTAVAFDGTRTPTAKVTPLEAFHSATRSLKSGDKDKAVSSLQYAAENGVPAAQWQLGRMYAKGDGVNKDDLRAFDYFSRIANAHADDSPGTPQARIVANAFVSLGRYYQTGIPNTHVKADISRALDMYSYAASYFGDPDGQYHLGRLHLDGTTTMPPDAWRAARWFARAAHKGQHQAQAMLGAMLFKGDQMPRQAARGLMWLTLARDAAGPDETWIADIYDSAFKQATDDERAMALRYLEAWLKGRRD
jgi:TPR repeat protein